jgi:hypothetical protein
MRLAVSGSSPNDPEAAAWAYTRLSLYQLQQGATKTSAGIVQCCTGSAKRLRARNAGAAVEYCLLCIVRVMPSSSCNTRRS